MRVIVRWYYRLLTLLALVALFQLVLITTPVTESLYEWLDVTSEPRTADVIVCLGGDTGRLIWTVDAYREGLAPTVVVSSLPGAAEWMRDKLVQCRIPPEAILVDHASGTTGEHPGGIAALPGIDPATNSFLLVTDHDHSRRVAMCFRKAGYRDFTIYGAGFKLRREAPYLRLCRWRVLVMPRLLYEYTALVKYWWQGKI